MNRAELQALCKRSGLPARGSNAALIARLDAALSRAAGVEKEVAGVAARNGCLKQTGETKKVTFAVEEGMVRRLRSRVICPPVVPNTMGKSAQAINNYGADNGVFVEVGADVPERQSRRHSLGADVPVRRSRRNSLGADVPLMRSRRNSLGADVPVRRSRRNSLSAEAQDCQLRSQVIRSPVVAKTRGKSAQAGFVEVGADAPLRRSSRNSLSAAKAEGVNVGAQVGASSRVTRRSSLAAAAAVLPPAVERKRGRGDAAGAQKSAQVEVPARITRSRSIAPVVMSPTVVENKRRKTADAQTNVELPTVSDVPRNDAPVTRSLRNRVVQVNNCVVDANNPATKGPIRGSRRKSVAVLPDMLENNTGLLAAEMNGEMNVRRSTRKSALPNMLNEENQDHNKMTRNENFQSGKCQCDERQQKVKEPIRRSKRSVAAVPLEEQDNGLYEEKILKIPMRRSTRKSVALNEVEKVSMDDTEIVAWEPERVGEEGFKLRKHRRSSLEIPSSANDSWNMEDFDGQKFRKQQNTQIPNEKDNTVGTQQASNSTTLNGRSSKRRRTTASEEVRSVKEANDDIITRETSKDAHKATCEYKESGSRVQEFVQVNATREEHSSGPLLVTVTLTDEISTAQIVPVVIPGSESGYNANENSDTNESSDKSKQEHSDIQAVDSHLSETSGELDQSSCIAGLVPHNFVVSEDKALMSKDGLSIDSTVGDHEEQSPVSGEGRVGLEANAIESGEKNLTGIMSTGLYTKSLQHDIDIVAEEIGKGDLEKSSLCSATPEYKHEYGLPEEIVLPSKNIGSLPNAEQSPFGLESLFFQESLDGSVGHDALASATAHTENGFDDSKDCHVKSALENTHVSEPFSHHDTEESISKNDDCMHTSQQDNGMEDAIENPSISLSTPGYKHEGALSEEAVPITKDYAGTCSSNHRELLMELQSLFSKENIKESYPHDVLAFPGPEKSGDESIIVEVNVHHDSSLSQLGSTDLLDEPIGCSNTEVLRQGHNHKDRSNEDRIEQVAFEPCTNRDDIVEAAAAAATKCIESGVVLLPSEERSNLSDRQLNPKLESPDIMVSDLNFDKDARNTLYDGSVVAVVRKKTPSGSGYYEHNVHQVSDICAMSEAAPIGVLEIGIAVEASSLLDEQLNPELDGEVEKHSLNCEADTSRILGTGSVMSKTALLSKDAHTICCQELELSNGLSSFIFPEESAICQYVSVLGSGPCQQHVNERTNMQATDNIETLNQHHEQYNRNNEDQTIHGIPASSVPEAIEMEQSEMEIGLIPVVEASVFPVPHEQLNNKLEGNEVDEDSCSYDTEFLNREASNLHKDDFMDMCSEDSHRNDLPALRSQQSSYFQNDNGSGSVGICQSSRRRGIDDELCAKRQSFKVSSTVKGSYIAKSAPRTKPGDSLRQSAIALRRNRKTTTAVKVGHPVKPNADRSVAKDSSIRCLQPINARPRDSLSQSGIALHRNGKDTTTAAVKSKANKPWL